MPDADAILESTRAQVSLDQAIDRLRASALAANRQLGLADDADWSARWDARLIHFKAPPPRAKPRGKRRPSLATIARQAAEAGLSVRGFRVEADGGISVLIGSPDIESDDDVSDPRWH